MGHLGRGIRRWHSFLKLTRGKVNFRSNWAKLGQISNFKILSPKYAHLVQFCLRIQKIYLFLCTTIKNAENCISNIWTDYLYLFFFFWPLHSQKQRYCLEILYACCLYVSDHISSSFLDNWKVFDVIGSYFWKKWNFEFWGQNKKYEKYEMATL